ncbi:hypothetical protein GGX14DRAFT_409034 [Mycena pura]|uniref:Uncharacterized protein n=1 Tax=Mycena pura TaxID=153505 RepID=A0AAD6UP44_9AGAR|nr:hypothetical protein GGX14DRAFT_409034 [Mycena pura]
MIHPLVFPSYGFPNIFPVCTTQVRSQGHRVLAPPGWSTPPPNTLALIAFMVYRQPPGNSIGMRVRECTTAETRRASSVGSFKVGPGYFVCREWRELRSWRRGTVWGAMHRMARLQTAGLHLIYGAGEGYFKCEEWDRSCDCVEHHVHQSCRHAPMSLGMFPMEADFSTAVMSPLVVGCRPSLVHDEPDVGRSQSFERKELPSARICWSDEGYTSMTV